MKESIFDNLSDFGEAAGYTALTLVLFFVGRYLYKASHKSIDVRNELIGKDNVAFSFTTVGYYIGLLLAIGGAISGPTIGFVDDIIALGIFGLLAVLLLNLSAVINDRFVFGKFSMKKEIVDDQNIGAGVIEAANFIASGLIILGAVSGEGVNFFPHLPLGWHLSGVITAVVFWMTGQLILMLFARLYNIMTPYDIHEHIEKDNVAVGVGYAGVLIAIGNLIRNGVGGDFHSWSDHFTWLSIEVVIGLLLLPIARWATDKILLPGASLTDEIVNQEKPNVGAALIEAFAYIGSSVIIIWSM